MPTLRAIDVHAHILTEETMGLLRRETPKFRTQLRDLDGDFATLDMGKISVGPPYFDAVFYPLMAPAVFLMGVGPMASWPT